MGVGRTINQENYGTAIGQIMAHLATNNPPLHAEVINGQNAF